MEQLTVVKIGGKVIDSEEQLAEILKDFAQIKGNKVLIHGGGTLASEFGKKLGVKAKLVEGRRITDAPSLDIVTMIYAGLINKKIVASLQAQNCNALGLSGADGNSIQAHKRINHKLDYGFVGDIDKVNDDLIANLLQTGFTPVFSAITHNLKGQLLNTNADTIASSIASAMAQRYEVRLLITFEQNGVLSDPKDSSSVIESITQVEFENLKTTGVISDGMIPKLDNGFAALNLGVEEVIVTSSSNFVKLEHPYTLLNLA